MHDLGGVLEHANEQGLFAGEVVVEAAAVDIGLAKDGGDTCRVVALLVEEPEGDVEDLGLGIRRSDGDFLDRSFNVLLIDRSTAI